VRIAREDHAERGDERIGARVLQRQRLGHAEDERRGDVVCPRLPPRELEQALGGVDAGRGRAAPRGRERGAAGAAADVDHVLPRLRIGGVHDGLRGSSQLRRDALVVAGAPLEGRTHRITLASISIATPSRPPCCRCKLVRTCSTLVFICLY
jgi:hypothetical protein